MILKTQEYNRTLEKILSNEIKNDAQLVFYETFINCYFPPIFKNRK